MLITILAFLFILAFSITIHEFGHFLTAKLFRIPVEKFSLGYGPPLIRMKIGETDFRIAYFPFGGYVKIAGEEEPTLKPLDTEGTELNDPLKPLKEDSDREVKGFYDAPIYKRVMIVLAGPVFNIISAVIVFMVIAGAYGLLVNPFMKIAVEPGSEAARAGLMTNDSIVTVSGIAVKDWDELLDVFTAQDGQVVTIGYIRDNARYEQEVRVALDSLGMSPIVPPVLGTLKLNGPAQQAGMRPGVRVIQIEGRRIETWDQMIEVIRRSRGIPLDFTWDDRGEIKRAQITPATFYDPLSQDTVGQIGAIMPLQRRHLSFTGVVSFSVRRSGEVLWLTVKTLYQLVVGRISRRALGGPIAIAQLSGESARWGFESLLGLLAIISINLGLVNLFPIPALDGGHVVIALVEAARRKRFSARTRLIIQQIGYALILLLIVYVTFNDITR